MADPVRASSEDQRLISTRCADFNTEVSALLRGFGEEISILITGALQTPAVVKQLQVVQGQIADCQAKLQTTMQSVSDDFKANADDYVENITSSEQLVTHVAQAQQFDYSYLR
jgi:hypothetical protein